MLGLRPPARPTRDRDTALLIDADYWTYMVPALVQHKMEDKPVNKEVELVCIDEERDIHVWVEPLNHAEFLVHREINRLKDTFRTDDITIFLTPKKGNFREEVAQSSGNPKSKVYKGQRTKVKPYYHLNIRGYIQRTFDCVMADGCEADDEVCIAQYDHIQEEKLSCIIGPDKDLKNMFGYLYNPMAGKENLTYTTPYETALHFFMQMIEGDKADNIPGLPGAGPAVVKKFFHDYEGCPVEQIEEEVFNLYLRKGFDMKFFLEQATLLHMRRRRDEPWTMGYDWEAGYREWEHHALID